MAFVRVKSNGKKWNPVTKRREYAVDRRCHHYLVENKREDGRVRQKVLCYFGPCDTAMAAVMHFREQAEYWQRRALGYDYRYVERGHPGSCGYYQYTQATITKAWSRRCKVQVKKYAAAAKKCLKHAKETNTMVICSCHECSQFRIWRTFYVDTARSGLALYTDYQMQRWSQVLSGEL
jgi:hypothetical protein